MISPTQATAAIRTTSPLDIQRLLPGPSAMNGLFFFLILFQSLEVTNIDPIA